MTDSNGSPGTAVVRHVASQVPQAPALGGNREAFNTAVRVAQSLAASTIVPDAYRDNVANCMVAMEYANRLGASVLAVMQNLDVIHGRPSLRATFLIGTVNASGRFTPLRFRWQGEEGKDSWGCRAVAKDRETGEECVGPLVTIDLAKKEGWFKKSGSKWQTIPELMLMYRAGAWWTRVYCPELGLGLHTTDEMEDLVAPIDTRARQVAAVLDAPDADGPRGELTPGPAREAAYNALVTQRAAHLDPDELRIWEDWAIGKPRDQWETADYERAIERMEKGEGLEGTGDAAKAGQAGLGL